MDKAKMAELRKAFQERLHSQGAEGPDKDERERSEYWKPSDTDFSDVVDAEREHMLYR